MAARDESLRKDVRDNIKSGRTGEGVGEGVGGVGGAVVGGGIGSVAGPVGTVIGAIAGAIGGWWAGKEVADTADGYSRNADTHYRNQFASDSSDTSGRFTSYDQARPLYELGYVASQNPDYRDRAFTDIEPDLQRGWNSDMQRQYGSWSDVRGTVNSAYDTARDLHMTRSEEELLVGKRQVQAGEIGLRKTVETEHVTKTVPLMHEEVEIERHALSGEEASNATIGDQDIRIPLTAEEAVVQKRVVGKEEVVVTKRAVQEDKEVEADLRRERIDVVKEGRVDEAADR